MWARTLKKELNGAALTYTYEERKCRDCIKEKNKQNALIVSRDAQDVLDIYYEVKGASTMSVSFKTQAHMHEYTNILTRTVYASRAADFNCKRSVSMESPFNSATPARLDERIRMDQTPRRSTFREESDKEREQGVRSSGWRVIEQDKKTRRTKHRPTRRMRVVR